VKLYCIYGIPKMVHMAPIVRLKAAPLSVRWLLKRIKKPLRWNIQSPKVSPVSVMITSQIAEWDARKKYTTVLINSCPWNDEHICSIYSQYMFFVTYIGYIWNIYFLYVTYIDYILNIYCNNICVINIFNICTAKSIAPMNIYVQ